MRKPLPIDSHLALICQHVRDSPITIVEAPPGSGKTTRVAPALMDLPFAMGQKIYLLQPRRIAAKSVGERIAWEYGSRIGQRIGYQVRFDSQVSRETQLIVATEGVLLRRLQEDVGLSDTNIVLLDEFHERSLDSDLLLGMLRRVQQAVRDDLKIVIMSATIDSELVQSQLGGAPIVRVESSNFPVAIRYRQTKAEDSLSDRMADAIRDAAETNDGDILAFLPGMGEIQTCYDSLSHTQLGRECDVMQLFGGMQIEDQAKAIEPGKRRRIILSTNVAETSLTIEGIRIVVDSGQARVNRFSPEVGLDRLVLENISQASATQRAGRAGRVAPGICFRLWSEASERARSAFLEPEIRRIDIVPAVLQLFAWGEGESDDFPWLEHPRSDSVARARNLLEQLGAVSNGRVTQIGKAMSRLPTHPRLARMVIAGFESGCYERTCMMAALLSERDPFQQSRNVSTRSAKRWDSDCIERLVALESFLDGRFVESPFGSLNRNAVRSIVSAAQQIKDQCTTVLRGTGIFEEQQSTDAEEAVMKAMLYGYPDRLARRRTVAKPNGVMVGGKGVVISPQSGVTESELFLCVDIDAGSGDAVVRQASRIDLEWLPNEQVVSGEELFFHPSQKQVVARKQTKWMDLVLTETPTTITDNQRCGEILWREAKKNWEQSFPTDMDDVRGLIERINCLRTWLPELELPELDETYLQDVARELCQNRRSLAELRSAPWGDWIRSRFTSEQWRAIEKEAPAKIQVPSGSWIKVQYEVGKTPTMSVKIQEVFSMKTTPRIARGRVSLLLHLLSPNMRPQQITDDLESFWTNGYPIVKKELKRRYPKHSWPDDPKTAAPGRR